MTEPIVDHETEGLDMAARPKGGNRIGLKRWVRRGIVVAVVLALTWLWRRYAHQLPASVYRASVYMAGITASFWFIERSVRMMVT